MGTAERGLSFPVVAAVATAAVMIAFQTAAKATRDALFLSSFDVALLPRMVVAAAVVSVPVALLAGRWMARLGPGRLVPAAFGVSSAFLVGEWAAIDVAPAVIAVVVYLHYAALGAVLISGFWSVVNERWDPRTAKRVVGRIAAGGTVGGLMGGLLAERAAVLLSVTTMLPILAALHLACAGLVLGMQAGRPVEAGRAESSGEDAQPERAGLRAVAGTSYLRSLVALVLVVTVVEVLVDFVFKARAVAAFGGGDQLLRLFALFYTATALLTVVVQAVGSRFTLQRLGLARTVALLPAGTAAAAAGALALPGLASATIARGLEAVIRNGLYRPAYELLFTPLAPPQKRGSKMIVDVGVVRLGDVTGAAVVQVVLLTVVGATTVLLGLAVVLAVLAAAVATRLHRGYLRTLERSLLSRAVQLDLEEVQDLTTRTAMMQSVGTMGLPWVATPAERIAPSERGGSPEPPIRTSAPADPEIARILELRSGSEARVRAALADGPLTRGTVPFAITLLAWDAIAQEAVAALRGVADRETGQIADRLLDPHEEFSVRRRLPLVLAACPTPRSVDGLLRGLEDQRFEVRYRCGHALWRVTDTGEGLVIDRGRVFDAVRREVTVDRGVWESHRLLDRLEDEEWSSVMDEMLRDRANRSLEHVFTVLALVLPRQPLKVAFRGLHTDDALLRGTALEYLESALPEDIRQLLWPFLEDTRKRAGARRSAEDILEQLLQSNQSIALNLERLRKEIRRSGPDPSAPSSD